MTDIALTVDNISVRFGALVAVDGVSLSIPRGRRHGILGPNGAGKTTLFNAITGFTPTSEGRVRLFDTDLSDLSAAARARSGLIRTFQITNLMPGLATVENVMLGSLMVSGEHRSWWRPYSGASTSVSRAEATLQMLGLSDVSHQRVDRLSYGDRRRVELAMALAAEPTVLLLDEPAAGLSIAEREEMLEVLVGLPEELTIVLIEHDVEMIFAFADSVSVLNLGSLVTTGPAQEVREDQRVKEVYLGSQ